MGSEVRFTMFFSQAQTGWSETWWYPLGLNTLFYARAEAMAASRMLMLNTNHQMVAMRITQEGANRFTRLILPGGNTLIDAGGGTINVQVKGSEQGFGGDLEGPSDQIRAAMHLEIIKAGQRIGLRYLAGIPDDLSLTENPTLNKSFNKVWYKLFNIWREKIITDGWAIKTLDKGVGFPLLPVQTYRLRTAAPSVLGVVIDSALPFTLGIGQKVAIQGVRMTRGGLDSPNGQWIIDGVEVNAPTAQRTIWLRGTEGFDPATFLTLGKVRGVSYTFTAPTWIEPIRVGIHKRGKPFGSPVGRRKSR
jgi:hypothetical protein